MRVLIAPLQWGLGHATRCVPIIKNYLEQNHEVIIASDGLALQLLQDEFPTLPFVELPSYNIEYKNKNLMWGVIFQAFKLLKTVYTENKIMSYLIQSQHIDQIISDNRLGCYSQKVKSIYITHQLNLPIQNFFVRFFGNKVHYFFIKKYAECWIPDIETPEKNISGALSHPIPKTLRTRVKYIGTLSRFKYSEETKIYSCIIVLSGPEPQRTIFENILVSQINAHWRELFYNKCDKICFVRGTEILNPNLNFLAQNIEVHNLLPSQILNKKILQSHFYIGRSGYTTLMDVIALQKLAILVPTPGQFEQEYLADFHALNPRFYTVSQNDFEIKKAYKSLISRAIQQ